MDHWVKVFAVQPEFVALGPQGGKREPTHATVL